MPGAGCCVDPSTLRSLTHRYPTRTVIAMSSTSNRFQDQVAVITGGARGIGLAIGKQLGKEGATVVLVDLLDTKAGVDELKELGIKATGKKLDVTNAANVDAVFGEIFGEFGKVDVLVQSAGIVGKTGIKTQDVDEKNFQLVMNINVKGIFLCCKRVLPEMAKRKYGRIVNIASIAGKEGNAGMLAYSTSKAAVVGLTKVIGKEYAELGITCNAIAPAVVKTPMVAAMPAQQVKYMTDKIPMKRCGLLEEIGSLCSFIASKECSFTTGFCFDATGGRATY